MAVMKLCGNMMSSEMLSRSGDEIRMRMAAACGDEVVMAMFLGQLKPSEAHVGERETEIMT